VGDPVLDSITHAEPGDAVREIEDRGYPVLAAVEPLFQSAAALDPAFGSTSGIHLPYTRMIIDQSLCPIWAATHTGFSPAVNIIDA